LLRAKENEMKNALSFLFAVAVLATGSAQGQGPLVFMKVDVQKAPNTGGSTDAKLLEIALSNAKTAGLTNLVVEYWIFSRNVENNEIAVAKEGTTPLTLGPSKRETIKSLAARFTYIGPKTKGSGKRVTTIPPTGTKFFGYGVRVSWDGKMLAEQFDPKDLKETLKELKRDPAPVVEDDGKPSQKERSRRKKP
jgi:hypothetical protein